MSTPEGDLLRTCSVPGCGKSWWWMQGPPRQGWQSHPDFGLLVCSDHGWMWSPGIHKPTLERPAGTGVCACGHTLPGATLGQMSRQWILHAGQILGATHPNTVVR